MKRLISTISLALLLCWAASAQVVESYNKLRTNSWSFYGAAGISGAMGNDLPVSVNPTLSSFIAPAFSGGVSFNVRPWFRISTGYDFSSFTREMRFPEVQPDGLSYRKMTKLYNAVDFTLEFNLMEVFYKRKSKRFNIYLGSGIGGMFAYGNDYTISMGEKETIDPDPWNNNFEFDAWLNANNRQLASNALYVPARLSFEYDVTPRLTMGVRGDGRYIFLTKAKDMMPISTQMLETVIRFNIVGKKHGYISRKNVISGLNVQLADMEAANAAALKAASQRESIESSIERNRQELALLREQIQIIARKIDDIQVSLVDKSNDLKVSVYFENGSHTLDENAVKTVEQVADMLLADKNLVVDLTSSATTVGNPQDNKKLSDRRVAAVKDLLHDCGVSKYQIGDVVSLGDVGQSTDPSCRRVLIVIR